MVVSARGTSPPAWSGFVGLVAALALAGCANWTTAYRTDGFTPNRTRTQTIDAKQRAIIMTPEQEWVYDASDPKHPIKRRNMMRVCAEASPDAFSAIAGSASAALRADVASKSGDARAAMAIAESAATIERTQTINLLRESFYRTCERYMNGAIGRESFTVQAGRDARAMVAILAIEQLTGVVKPPATIISGPATAAKAELSSRSLAMLDDAQKRRRDAEAQLNTAKADAAANCDTLTDADAKAACQKKRDAATPQLDSLKAAADRADRDVQDIKAVAATGGGDLAEAATQAGPSQAGGVSAPVAQAVVGVANQVVEIVKEVTRKDDMSAYCIERLGSADLALKPPPGSLEESCMGLLATAANAEANDLSAQIAAYRVSPAAIQTASLTKDTVSRIAEAIRSSGAAYPHVRDAAAKIVVGFCSELDATACADFVPNLKGLPAAKLGELERAILAAIKGE